MTIASRLGRQKLGGPPNLARPSSSFPTGLIGTLQLCLRSADFLTRVGWHSSLSGHPAFAAYGRKKASSWATGTAPLSHTGDSGRP